MRRSYEFEVNEIKYIGTTLPGKKGISCVTRLLKLLGPSISGALKGLDIEKKTIDDTALASSAQFLFENMDSVKVVKLIEDLLESVEAWTSDRKVKADLDDHFSGDYGALVKVLFIVIKENFSSFFGGSVSNLLDMLPQSLKQSPKEK